MNLNNSIYIQILLVIIAATLIFVIAKIYGKIKFLVSQHSYLKLFLIALFIPATGEEILFRGGLIFTRSEPQSFVAFSVISLVLFIAWHYLMSKFLPNSASQTFKKFWFLFCAGIIGVVGNILVFLNGNLWGAILFHALIVSLWQKFFSGILWFSHSEKNEY